MPKSTKKNTAKRRQPRERRERRFEPRAATSPRLVYAVGAVGAILMGAGAWGQFGSLLHDGGPQPFKYAPYVLALGSLLVGVAIWFGTSGEPALRVGDAGLAIDKGGLRRVPWYAIERVEWLAAEETVRVTGKDEAGVTTTLLVETKTHPQAAAWIVKEARERIPSAVDVPDDATLPQPLSAAGEKLPLEPPQVVGRHCASSGKVIAYEPDARLCPRCERVYHKAHVPDACACGASLAGLQAQAKAG